MFVKRSTFLPILQVVTVRHILVHDYFVIDIDFVWDAVERDLPPLRDNIEGMLLEQQETNS